MDLLRYDASGIRVEQIGDELGVSSPQRQSLDSRLNDAAAAIKYAHESGTLGFMSCLDRDVSDIVSWAKSKHQEGWTDQVVFGIGGSSLGARAILDTATPVQRKGLRTHFSENIDPVSVKALLESLPLETTLFLIITKSGTTIETMGQFSIAYEFVRQRVEASRLHEHFIAITDPQQGSLRALVNELGLQSFEVPPNVGGRFSALTPVGIVPLALAGYPVKDLLEGAKQARLVALSDPSVTNNPLSQMVADQFTLYQRGVHESVMMAYSDQLLSLVDWFSQLWAESLGKSSNRRGEDVYVGLTPIKAWGVVDQHSQVQLYMEGPKNKLIMFLEVEQFHEDVQIPHSPVLPDSLAHLAGQQLSDVLKAELAGTRAALTQAQRPTVRWVFRRIDPSAIGFFMLSWEYITAMMGELLDINAFDQPGVELGKKIAHGLLGQTKNQKYAELVKSSDNLSNGIWCCSLLKDGK